jgi:hypothetical protein
MPLHQSHRGGQLLWPIDREERSRLAQQGDRRRLRRNISRTKRQGANLREIVLPPMQVLEHRRKIVRSHTHGDDRSRLGSQLQLALR